MEEAVTFKSSGKSLFGILHMPASAREGAAAEPAITSMLLMVLGGPQTRVGCHRAYTHLGRMLSGRGLPVLRFDYEGQGDAEGAFVGYEYAAPSIRSSIDYVYGRFPSLKNLVVWSLCDGSAACAVYAPHDRRRIAGMVLCNPFVHSEQGKARAYLKHYYVRRLFQKDFLLGIFMGKFNPFVSAASLFGLVAKAMAGRSAPASGGDAPKAMPVTQAAKAARAVSKDPAPPMAPGCFREEFVREEVLKGIQDFGKPIRFLLSGEDMTALEFEGVMKADRQASRLLEQKRIGISRITGADHTFSRSAFRRQVVEETVSAFEAMCGTHARKED